LKIYHFSGDRSVSDRFFRESLVEYIEASGLNIPAAALRQQTGKRRGPHGKPYFEYPALEGVFFSRSHTPGHEILCFSGSEIGVDCESTEGRPGIGERYMSIAQRCFTEDEQAYVRESSGTAGGKEDDPIARFFEIWTAKEAYMKYTGNGFSEGFRTFSVFRIPHVIIETGRLSDAPDVVYSVCTGRNDM